MDRLYSTILDQTTTLRVGPKHDLPHIHTYTHTRNKGLVNISPPSWMRWNVGQVALLLKDGEHDQWDLMGKVNQRDLENTHK